MFYLNHNDIEGLFRDAAENYQMNTDRAFDWNRINNAIHKNDNRKSPKNKKNWRNLMLLLLLLIATGLGTYYISSFEFQKKLLQNNGAVKNNSSNNHNNNDAGTIEENKANEMQNNDKQHPATKKSSNDVSTASALPVKNFPTLTTKNDQSDSYNSNNAIILPSDEKRENVLRDASGSILNAPITEHQQPKNKDNASQINTPANNADQPTSSNITRQKNSSANKKITAIKSSGFYAGALVGPDLTFVEFQKTSNVGITFGLTVGYQFSKRWSIETGLLLDKKNYYTKGEYFDKTNIPNLYNAELVSVNGSCNMLEMPLNVRYKFPSNNTHQNFTASLGTSTYFMTREDYDYTAVSNGWDVNGSLTNYPSSTHLFAVINFGAGYERNISNTLSMRIEPYFKVPVKGIGTGDLYMSSTGINIGVTKYFGKK